MNLPEDLPDLLGATLDHMSIDWRNAIVRVSFLKRPSQVESHSLRVHGVSGVSLTRGAGASRIVREARADTGQGGSAVSLHLQMESGERIVIDGASFGVDPVGG
jgi:hypothetical protein